MIKNRPISHSQLLQLKRWNTPTIYNGWEQVTALDPARDAFNLEQTMDFMPQMGPMVGYAVTVVVQPSDPNIPKRNPSAKSDYRRYVASVPEPKIVVVQDIDKPELYGSFWGEVNGNIHRALGCVGTITDGGIRDLDEMTNAGFKVLARRLCVGHAHSCPLKWDCDVEVFGRRIRPGQFIHADKHGFIAIPQQDLENLLDAVLFMDANENNTLIAAARSAEGKSCEQILEEIDEAAARFAREKRKKFGLAGRKK